jgi:isocitrate dehydrogenase
MKAYNNVSVPVYGDPIQYQDGKFIVPDKPIVPFIEGDGTGPDIWRASRAVFDAAVAKVYGGKRQVAWYEIFAGEKAFSQFNNWLPQDSLDAITEFRIAIKGPLTTPVGGGIRSLNVSLRQLLNLYVCWRPVRYYAGVPSPMKNPEKLNVVIFRENTEDVYAGIEWRQGTPEAKKVIDWLNTEMGCTIRTDSGIGIKPMSVTGSKRLIRRAIQYALANQRKSVTLVHKGNIMKFTEGAFRTWGYQVAEQEFGEQTYTSLQWERTKAALGEAAANAELAQAMAAGKLHINDVITDAVFEQTITNPREFDVLAAPNLNGDYLSDALAAQVGGLGVAPGANINYETGAAVFEATHGTAPKLAGLNKVNPSSVILSGEMLLRYLGWSEAADLVIQGIEGAIAARTLTADLYQLVDGATQVGTREFGQAVIAHMAAK